MLENVKLVTLKKFHCPNKQLLIIWIENWGIDCKII